MNWEEYSKKREWWRFLTMKIEHVLFLKKEKKVSKSAATFSPGKYVASARSNLYHEPKCEWAKKIKKDRRLWFTEKEEAWQKGFKAHNCSWSLKWITFSKTFPFIFWLL